MNKNYVGEGKVFLIAGGGKIYTDIAARFVSSEKSLEEIISSSYDANLVKKIVDSGHKAALEFDYFLFGVEGYSRVTEVQLVRKRIASYMIKTGRANKKGKRSFDVVLPKTITDFDIDYLIDSNTSLRLNAEDIIEIIEMWYEKGIQLDKKEEDLRYLKPQATEFKAIIGMNAHALTEWFQIRCCKNAQTEIRDMAMKMLSICKQVVPDIFQNAGANCKVLGYCPENDLQNESCKGKIFTKNEALKILNERR